MGKLKQWLVYHKQIKRKKADLAFLDCDIKFFEQHFKARELPQKLKGLRLDLKREQQKDESKKDNTKINDIAYEVAHKEKMQQNYEAMLKTALDLQGYINLLNTWKKNI